MVLAGMLREWARKRQERFDREVDVAVDKAFSVAFDKGMDEAAARIVAKAVAESNAKWRAWLAREAAAKARNEPFDEPPPG